MLAAVTVAWTLAVAVGAIAAGTKASSIALTGLGLESAIEPLAAAIVIWQLSGGQERESRAVRLVRVTFLAGAVYLAAESIRELADHAHSGPSAARLAVAAAAFVVMSLLAAALAGVGLDTWLGWWWAVPAAGLAIAAVAVIEVIEIWAHR